MRIVLAVVLILIALAIPFLLPPSRNGVAAFAAIFLVPMTAETEPVLRRYIWHSRISRVLGAVGGFVAVTAYEWEQSTGLGTYSYLAFAFGYAFGAVVYEIFRDHPGVGAPAASLWSRSLVSYIGRPTALLNAAFAGGVVILLALSPLWQPSAASAVQPYSTTRLLVVGIGAIFVFASTMALGQWLAVAPVEGATSPLSAAEHAIRFSALIALAGVSVMCTAGALSSFCRVIFSTSNGPAKAAAGAGWVFTLMIAGTAFLVTVTSLPRLASLKSLERAGISPGGMTDAEQSVP